MSTRWSVRRRVAWQLGGLVFVLVVGVTGLSVWFLKTTVDRSLRSLANEELAEIRTLFLGSTQTTPAFDRIVSDLGKLHPTTPLGWRVWNDDGTVWHEVARAELLRQMPQTLPEPGVERVLGGSVYWNAARLNGRVLGIAVDGSVELAIVRKQVVIILALGIALGLVTVMSGVLFARHVSNLLRRVAADARAGTTFPQAATRGTIPDEIRDVAVALTEMRSALRGEIERQQLMVAGVAHELRSPIQNLLGEAEVLLRRERDAHEYREVIESQVDELRDLGRAVDNLVSLCAPTQPRAATELEAFDLGREAELRLTKEIALAQKRGIRVELNKSGDLSMHGDREALLLALRNLVSNAIAWSPEGEVIHVTLTGNAEGIEVTVDDAGPGVPHEEHARIFETFYRGPAAQDQRVGYGLGLALTRVAVEAHRGSIEVAKSPTGGARFHLVLPSGRTARRS